MLGRWAAGGHARSPEVVEATNATVRILNQGVVAMTQGAMIAVVDQERKDRKFLCAALSRQGFRLIESATGGDGIAQAMRARADLILPELALPDLDGVAFIRQIRALSAIPIIVISGRDHESDKVAALDAGADDFVAKPFHVGELLARVRAVLRRCQGQRTPQQPVFQVGDLQLDWDHRQVFVAGTEIHLTPIEFRILATLIKSAGSVVTHQQLFSDVWGASRQLDAHALRVYVSYLRHKIEPNPTHPRFVQTEPGIGYRLSIADRASNAPSEC
jgi:two-component system KDP operon response regulator KdpE